MKDEEIIQLRAKIVALEKESADLRRKMDKKAEEHLQQQLLQEKIDDKNRHLLKEANEKLLEYHERSRLENLSKSDFLANMSHEIRTPLNIILGMANLLAETSLNTTQAKYLNSLRVTGRQLMEILNNILEFSRIEAGKIAFQPEPFSLQRIINQIEASALPLCLQKNIDFRVKLDPLLVMERVGDSLKIFQILLNLINNAVKFTDKGSITLKLEENFRKKDGLLIKVIDTGIGISEDQQHVIFDRFTQANSSLSQTHRGAGLGLAISQKLIKSMGGSLSVISVVGNGSTFCCALPLPTVAPSERRRIRIDGTMILPENFPDIHILAVDDIKENLEVIKVYLKKYPVTIDTANNGKKALSLIEQKAYDIILMDVRMPVMDGITATKRIRENERNTEDKGETILAITAHAFQEQRNKFIEAGFDGVLTKPFFKRDLVQTLYKFSAEERKSPPPNQMGNKALGYCLEHEMTEEIPNSLKEILPDLFQTIARDIQDITESLEINDFDTVYSTAHSLRGVSGMFGFLQLSSFIADLSHSVKAGNYVLASELLSTIDSYLADLKKRLVD